MKRLFIALFFVLGSLFATPSFAQEQPVEDLESLKQQANAYYEASMYREAIEPIDRVIHIMYKSEGLSNPEINTYFFMLGVCYENVGNYQNALTCYNNLAIGYKYLYDETNDKNSAHNYRFGYAIALSCMSQCHAMLSDYSQAVLLQENTVTLMLQLFGQDNEYFWDHYLSLGTCYLHADRFQEASEVLTSCIEYYKASEGDNDAIIAETYNRLGIVEQKLHRYDKSIEYFELGLDILDKTAKPTDFVYVAPYVNLGMVYATLGLYDKAHSYYKMALQPYKEYIDRLHELDVEQLRQLSALFLNLGQLYRDIGQPYEALEQYELSLQIKQALYGEKHSSIATIYLNMSYCYLDLNNFAAAKECKQKYRDIVFDIYDETSPRYAAAFVVSDVYDAEVDTPEQKIEEYTRISQILLDSYGEVSSEYRMCLGELARYNYLLGNYDEALRYYIQSAEILERVYGPEHPDYAGALIDIGAYYESIDDLKRAKEYYVKAVNISYNAYGILHPTYFDRLSTLHNCNYRLGDMRACKDSVVEMAYIAQNLMSNALTYLTMEEINKYWDSYEYIFRGNLPYYAYHFPNDDELLRATYECALLSKGFLLNAERGLRSLIMESDNEEMLKLYDRLSVKQQQLEYLYSLDVSQRTDSVEELEQEVRNLSNQLQHRCNDFSQYMNNINITARDVKAKLQKVDAAIEFLSLDIDDDNKEYCALVLKCDYYTPRLVKLFSQRDLDELKAKYENADGMIYTDPQLYDLVWKPLETELKDIKNIYFSPVDDLYQIAIEYATDGKHMISSTKRLYRLSSTRQLAVVNDNQQNTSSVVFGGLDYNADVDALVAHNADGKDGGWYSSDVDVEQFSFRGAVAKSRGVKHLPGTEIEANDVSQVLANAGVNNTLIVGADGTETSFKLLSGQQTNIIHIATHGFYWEGQQTASDDKNYLREDPSMLLSGLLFSGSNHTLLGHNERVEGLDDGILTAAEIARMDLRGTNLLVLSACQTGLGRISGDGVFGLQRGFKKAGVNTIIMSLWEVDDTATQLLMRYFYENIGRGVSSAHALASAQDMLKSYPDYDYSSPFYWAGFIVLDGIN